MKGPSILAEVEGKFREIFEKIPFTNSPKFRRLNTQNAPYMPELVVELSTKNSHFRLLVDIKDKLQPRQVHAIAAQLKQYQSQKEEIPCIATTYISTKSAQLCETYGVNFVDLSGNCHLALPNIYIEIKGEDGAVLEKRELRSLFGMKSSRILAVLLNESLHPWKVTQLSEQSSVSLGLVSKVKRKLLDQEYAISAAGGLKVTQPQSLIEDWGRDYAKQLKQKQTYYTLLSGESKAEALIRAMIEAQHQGARLMLSGFSAARWIAPYSKSSTESLYADSVGEHILEDYLQLEIVESGANIIVEMPKDDFLFSLAKKTTDGLLYSAPIQTYLDLRKFGDRGIEAAEHILQSVLLDNWKGHG